MAVEETVKQILQEVIDVKPEEIEGDKSLQDAFEVDSTEMVEITVGIKKALGIEDMQNNDLKKEQTFNEIVEFLKTKGVS